MGPIIKKPYEGLFPPPPVEVYACSSVKLHLCYTTFYPWIHSSTLASTSLFTPQHSANEEWRISSHWSLHHVYLFHWTPALARKHEKTCFAIPLSPGLLPYLNLDRWALLTWMELGVGGELQEALVYPFKYCGIFVIVESGPVGLINAKPHWL